MLILAILIPFFLNLHFFFLFRRLIESLRIVIIVIVIKEGLFFLLHFVFLFTFSLKLRFCFNFHIIKPCTLGDFRFVHSFSESFVPALAEVEIFPPWDFEVLHDLASLTKDVLSLHFGVASDEICESDFHFWKESPPSALLFLEFFGLVPSCQVFGVYFLLSGFGSDNFGQGIAGTIQLLSNLSNQPFFELNGITLISDSSYSLFGPIFLLHFTLLLLFGQFIRLLCQLRINSIKLMLVPDDQSCCKSKWPKFFNKFMGDGIECLQCLL